MLKNLIVLFCSVSWICLAGCNIRTPEIRGVVLDEETKQPVEGAWVTATLELKTKTIQGDVYNTLSIDKPHTRTDKDGRFTIPPRKFKKPFPPEGFGTEVMALRIGASTVDDKGGASRYFGGDYRKHFGMGAGDLHQILRKDIFELTIYSKPVIRTENEYFSHLQSLYSYCFSGRFSVERPAVEGGCDEWELNYAITKHKRYLEKLREPKTIDQENYYSATMKRLAYLYKMNKDYKKALETFNKVRVFEEKRGVHLWLKELENQINELQRKLEGG